jgi:hypothetical protein
MKDDRQWKSLCSAMDAIEDTAMAARSYAAQKDSRDKGLLYLETYGLLQALVLQQDAVSDLCVALGSSRAKGNFPGLMRVRNVRVSVAGHPTKRQREGTGPHFLVQMSLGHGSVEVMSFTSDEPIFTHVSLNDLLREQENELETVLGGVIQDLEEAEAKHKAPFRGRKLEAVFPNTLSYLFEKIHDQIRNETLAPMGIWGIEQVRKTVEDFRLELEERGIQMDTSDSIKYHYDLLAYPLDHMEAYLHRNVSDIRAAQTAYIFAFFIEKQVEELRVIAREIDEEFNS